MQLTHLQRRGAIAAGVIVIAAVVFFAAQSRKTSETQLAAKAPPVSAIAATHAASNASPQETASTDARRDPVGHASDLHALHDRYHRSADPAERRIARRAFSACIPAFLPPAGQRASVEPLVKALPAAQRSEREAAWRDLYSRCEGFAGDARESVIESNTTWRRDKDSAEPGRQAVNAVRAGRLDEAESLVGSISRGDPAAIDSLAGIAVQLARRRDADDRDLALRAEAVDAALPLVACDLGMACDAQSLRAIELCAVEAVCSGDVAQRILARPGIDPGIAAAAQRERARIAARIRAGGQVTLADLLP